METLGHDAFLATLNHALRTPLTAVLGCAEMLAEQDIGALNDRQRRAVAHLNLSGQRLLTLLSDLVDLQELSAGTLRVEPTLVDVAALGGASIEAVRSAARAKGIALTLNCPAALILHTDAKRLQQVLVHLLRNAVTFTPEGGHVGLQVSADGDHIALTVWDTGVGMTAAELSRVVEMFQQTDVRAMQRMAGSGLGLAVVKSVSHALGARLAVVSEAGRGSRLTLTLPATPAHRAPGA